MSDYIDISVARCIVDIIVDNKVCVLRVEPHCEVHNRNVHDCIASNSGLDSSINSASLSIEPEKEKRKEMEKEKESEEIHRREDEHSFENELSMM